MSPSLRENRGLRTRATEAQGVADDSDRASGPIAVKLTALMIDDELSLTRAMEARLASVGVELAAALTGAQGVMEAQQQQPDLILLDVRLPDMDGFEALARLRAQPETASIPVIFLTASASDATRARALEAGACAFFAKPFDAANLLRAVERALPPGAMTSCATKGNEEKDA